MAYLVPTLAYVGVGCLGPPSPELGLLATLAALPRPYRSSLTSRPRPRKADAFAFVKAARDSSRIFNAELLQRTRDPHRTTLCMVRIAYCSNPCAILLMCDSVAHLSEA